MDEKKVQKNNIIYVSICIKYDTYITKTYTDKNKAIKDAKYLAEYGSITEFYIYECYTDEDKVGKLISEYSTWND